jgi:hypothetical protein
MKFDLGTVLSVTDGHLFTSMDNVYKILNFMTGDDLFTHQLPRAMDECAPEIMKQYPMLSEFKTNSGTIENVESVLKQAVETYGNEFEIEPLANNEHKIIDPLVEAQSMLGKNTKIIIPVII